MRTASPLLLLALAALLPLAGCDAASSSGTPSEASGDTEAAALTIASAVALDGGGVLDEAATAALATVPTAGAAGGDGPGHGRPGCSREQTLDPETMVWTVTLACERGRPDGLFYAAFQRTATALFTAAGVPQPQASGADRLAYALVSGEGLRRTPHGVHRLTRLSASLDVTGLDGDTVTVTGTYARAGADSLATRRGTRTSSYTLDVTATDLQGPRARYATWDRPYAGTLSGVYRATITRVGAGGTTVTREVEHSFTVTFPGDGEAEIAIDGQRFRADATTGEIVVLR